MKPITMSPAMVEALPPDNKPRPKSKTRRLIKITHRTPGLAACLEPSDPSWVRPQVAAELCPYGKPGERLYVREEMWRWGRWISDGTVTATLKKKWKFLPVGHSVRYADNRPKTTAKRDGECGWVYRHARFMPKEMARYILTLTEVRVERLQEISKEDALAEGCSTDAFVKWALPLARTHKTENLYWLEKPKGSSDEDYCYECARKKLEEVKVSEGDSEDLFLAGACGAYESDGPRFCETCGVELDVVLTDYAKEEELIHFSSASTSGASAAHALVRLANAISEEEERRAFAKIAFRCLWESIHGEGSWGLNPWAWVLTFETEVC